jgi:hypothetical protein
MNVNHYWDPINDFIHDFYLLKPVDFVITDGLQGSENGPMAFASKSLEEAQKNMRLILAGKDALAVDAIHAYTIGIDPQDVDYMTLLAEENIGIIDPANIDVVGNARVDEVKKSFGVPGFPFSTLFRGPKRRIYKDFEAPEVEIQNVNLTGITLTANVTSDEELVKLDIYAGGSYLETIQAGGSDIEVSVVNDMLKPNSQVGIYAYDKYLNCSITNLDI